MNKDDYTWCRYWFGEFLNGWSGAMSDAESRNTQLRALLQQMGGMAGVW